jgi:UDP-N-acetylmuramate dehydrogenase
MALSIRENISLNPFISFRVGGLARYWAEPENRESLEEALAWAKAQGLPIYLFGKGTNLVFSDQGYPGLAICTHRMDSIDFLENRVRVQAGSLLHTVVGQSVKKGLAGIQHLAGIPGTLGGGVYINAGAFGQELKDVVVEVISVTRNGEIRRRDKAECGFTYRHSNFMQGDEIILEAELALQPCDSDTLADEMRETLIKRKSKQPLQYPNAGSMFKRPPGTYAGHLIEQAGLKGLRVGGAEISEHHANFVVNKGGATAQDIWDLSSEAILRVEAHCGIRMEREVIFVGEFQPWPR